MKTNVRNPRELVDEFSPVMKLVYLAMFGDIVDIDQTKSHLVRISRLAYNDELSIQAERVGCAGRSGRLTNGQILSELSDMFKPDALSIINTYNYDLAVSIAFIKQGNKFANRHSYARKLVEWQQNRSKWKVPQINQVTIGKARAKAQQDFIDQNQLDGTALLTPRTAVCPICQGWIKRGVIPARVAKNNPPPYHINCPHIFSYRYKKIPQGDCADLWMGD